MKHLIEKRNTLLDKLDAMMALSKVETRSFTEEELATYETTKLEIANIDKTLKAEEETRAMEKKEPTKVDSKEEQRILDEDNFVKFLRGEERALAVADNGGIIPTHIANRIIETVKELSPIYNLVDVYNVGGDLVFPVYDESTSSIGAAYVDDLTELTEGTGKFTTVKLQNFIVGCLAKVSKSLMNRTDFDLIGFVVRKVAQAIAEFLEKELIKGTVGKMTGIDSTTNIVTSATVAKVDADDLIDLQMAVPEVYQGKAVWIMHKNTLKAIRKLKDLDGNYLLQRDITNGFGWNLLGKPVSFTASADEVVTGKKAVFYGDMEGLALKLAQNVQIQILVEKYATQHAIGIVAYVEADSKIVDNQKIAALKVK